MGNLWDFLITLRCDQCKQNEATIFLTQIIESQTTKTALCATVWRPPDFV